MFWRVFLYEIVYINYKNINTFINFQLFDISFLDFICYDNKKPKSKDFDSMIMTKKYIFSFNSFLKFIYRYLLHYSYYCHPCLLIETRSNSFKKGWTTIKKLNLMMFIAFFLERERNEQKLKACLFMHFFSSSLTNDFQSLKNVMKFFFMGIF